MPPACSTCWRPGRPRGRRGLAPAGRALAASGGCACRPTARGARRAPRPRRIGRTRRLSRPPSRCSWTRPSRRGVVRARGCRAGRLSTVTGPSAVGADRGRLDVLGEAGARRSWQPGGPATLSRRPSARPWPASRRDRAGMARLTTPFLETNDHAAGREPPQSTSWLGRAQRGPVAGGESWSLSGRPGASMRPPAGRTFATGRAYGFLGLTRCQSCRKCVEAAAAGPVELVERADLGRPHATPLVGWTRVIDEMVGARRSPRYQVLQATHWGCRVAAGRVEGSVASSRWPGLSPPPAALPQAHASGAIRRGCELGSARWSARL
jgi:hypothetical protein